MPTSDSDRRLKEQFFERNPHPHNGVRYGACPQCQPEIMADGLKQVMIDYAAMYGVEALTRVWADALGSIVDSGPTKEGQSES